ncbi:MAG TPA: hypothetical protein VHV77_17975 [Pirellulales bacterium]|nr:hypothetical protein [Pirellulales bacterium]
MKLACLVTFVWLTASAAAWAQEGALPSKPVPDRATLEKQFEENMSGATLVGVFTVAGREEAKNPKEERYTISKVTKVRDDYWTFHARIQYGNHDTTLPLTLAVKWAGDTPVITLDDVMVPGFGTFTCRVMIFDDQYAGTWSGGDHGGHMFGRIEHDK